MKIEMEFQGLQELMKAFEDAASDEDIRAVNKKIVEQGEPVVKRIMSGKIPKSADIKLSGRGFGSKSSVTSHAADSVPLGAVKVKDTGASANVGWEKSDNSEHFYVKFINWGTIYRPPQEFIYATGREADAELQKIAEQEYQSYLDNTLKRGDSVNSPDIIKDASDALRTISDRGITVMQGWYDKDIHDRHVTLWDLGEDDENFSDDDAEGVTLSLQVTIFSESDEVELAREIKKLMKEKDFSFEGRNGDDSKPEDGIYMKAQRFSKFYEMEE